ncbi:hypothetical protein [Streptomyces sp. NPDC004658]|uniref:hypothetical protein n=1 Tax=Streptomyces sp. NPDC004658 TaxID=3154672 RepID=UPI0033BE38FE
MEREPAAKSTSWGDLSTSLVVSGQEVDTAPLLAALRLAGSEEFSSREGVSVHSGPGRATLTVDERHSKSVDGQAAALVAFLGPRQSALDALREAGQSVRVDVTGVAEPGSGLFISPDVLAGLAELGVPVTFTTVRASGEDEEDPLAWLG